MCLLCVEINKQTINGMDFAKNLEEVLQTNPEHGKEIFDALNKANPDYLDKLEKELMDKLQDDLFNYVIKL